jgi:hypothetical protein
MIHWENPGYTIWLQTQKVVFQGKCPGLPAHYSQLPRQIDHAQALMQEAELAVASRLAVSTSLYLNIFWTGVTRV